MTRRHSIRDYLQDIARMIETLDGFVADMTFEEFVAEEKTVLAVTRGLEIIGEAASKIPKPVLANYPTIEWADVIGMRHRIAHDYFDIDLTIVWDTIKYNLSELKPVVEEMLAQLPEEE